MNPSLMWLLDGIADIPPTDCKIADMTLDSREVRAGSLFFALPGRHAHGMDFAAEAAKRGAAAILFEPAPGVQAHGLPPGLFVAPVEGLKDKVGRLADRFFNWPSSHLRVTGITGTNGKTTCAYLLAQCLERLGSRSSYIGTVGWGRIGSLAPPTLTTPDVVTLHRSLAELRAQGVRDVAMEVSSQALDQDRIAAVRMQCAAFTNLSRDHLDYHGSMEAYGAAKLRLFDAAGLKRAVVNVDDEFGRECVRRLAGRLPVTSVWAGGEESGWMAEEWLRGRELRFNAHGISMRLDGSFGTGMLEAKLLGRFNAENALTVMGCLLSLGASLEESAHALAQCLPPPGRMEIVEAAAPGKPMAVVDYAHTPDALSKALTALREHCAGTLWCVFGCGGDRDPGKRIIMGAIADELADRIIVTDDNPRSENPEAITRAIARGIQSQTPRIIHDRAEAIGTALSEARDSDVVLIAGKGHEDYQIYGETRRSFSDREEAQRFLGVAA